ncbi:MAG: hypothetical protein H0U62_08410 [Actinobacteria bacterium]|nr:hypothetical protein [Actinomycetota bacterium]
MDPLRAIPEFHYAERDILMDFVDPPPEGRPDPDAVERALDIVDVTMVCLPSSERIRLGFLSGLGFTPALATRGWVCVRR